MEDMSTIVLEQADRLFQQHATKQVLSAADAGHWPSALWAALEDAGVPLALVPEAAGGVGLPALDVANLIRRAAFYSVPLPLAETIMANRLWTDAGGDPLEGAVTLGPTNNADRLTVKPQGSGWRLSGLARYVPWGLEATNLIFAQDESGAGYLARVPASGAASSKRRRNIAYEPRDEISFDDIKLGSDDVLKAPAWLTESGLMPFGAAIRSQQMVGGMERCLDYALTYANERVQFGRPIAKFQAVQHMLAIAAGHFAAATAAADTLAQFARLGDDRLAVAIAKARCGEAAGQVAAACQQVHGAMGFTQEHPLHFASRRLWCWRDEWGAEAFWQEMIGRTICAVGGEGFWPLLVDPKPKEAVTPA